jgi:glutaminase
MSKRFLPLTAELKRIFERVRSNDAGEVATYIPALAEADPRWFGVSLMTVDGGRYDLGHSDQEFTIQSVSKPFVFGLALDEHGLDGVTERVGVEPSGDPFNAIELDMATHRPYNPMVNTGAIVTTSLVPGQDTAERTEQIVAGLSRFAGRRLDVDEQVFRSERDTGDRNFAIGYLLRNFEMLSGDVTGVLESYFRQCSVLVTVADLAVMAATLANGGINPVTGERAIARQNVARVLSVMSSCGMYDYAGEWVFKVGLPAKSGVSGAVVAVLPGEFGMAVFSPRLDSHGNSVRGVAFCEEFSGRFGLHLMGTAPTARRVIRRTYRGDAVRSMRVRTAAEAQVLSDRGAVIRVLELQGDLRFGTAEALGRAVNEQLDDARLIVLDLGRVNTVDWSVNGLLASMAKLVRGSKADLILAGAPGDLATRVGARAFNDIDSALEWCEEHVLSAVLGNRSAERIELAVCDLLSGLPATVVERIEAAGTVEKFQAGAVIFTEGDPADALYFVLTGRLDVLLARGDSAERISSLGPGAGFGEVGALFGGLRSGSVRAAVDTECFSVPWAAVRGICGEKPAVLDRLYANIAGSLAARLRQADEARRAL